MNQYIITTIWNPSVEKKPDKTWAVIALPVIPELDETSINYIEDAVLSLYPDYRVWSCAQVPYRVPFSPEDV